MRSFERACQSVKNATSLTRAEAASALADVLDTPVDDARVTEFLIALSKKGESVDEIAGFLDCLKQRALPVELTQARDDCARTPLIDVCGTGGDASQTFNVSTTVALVLAACGQRVVKHGNRSVSSQCGSFDLLDALGINFAPDAVAENLDKHHIAFLFAPHFHPAFKNLAALRKKMGVVTVLNILGPLVNPIRELRHQMIGVYKPDLVKHIAAVLQSQGHTDAVVVYGHGGLDEFSLSGPNRVAHLKDGSISEYEVDALAYRIPRASIAELRGGTAFTNARIVEQIFAGESGPHQDIVVFNAAAALVVSGAARDFLEGIELARAAIIDGRAHRLLTQLRAASKRAA